MTSVTRTASELRWRDFDEDRLIDIAERKPSYLFSGRNGSQIRLSVNAHRLLRLRQSGVSSEEIAEVLTRTQGRVISSAEVEEKYQRLLERIEKIEDESRDNPMGFWIRIRLIPEALVARLALFLAPLFRTWVVVFLISALAAAFALAGVGPLIQEFSASSFWAGYALLMVSIVFHELGHASACAYYGARPSDIGFTLYLIYPALYSDVSSAWRLKRWQRVVVDLGGLYFQWIVAGAYLAAYLYFRWEPLRAALLMILGSSIFSLNPIFKFDGYWVMADSLGITNLSRQPARIFTHYARRLRGLPVEPLPWSGPVAAFLSLYSVASIAVWFLFLWMIGPRVWNAVSSLPAEIQAFLDGTPQGKLSSVLMSGFMTLVMVFVAWRTVRSAIVRPLVAAVRRIREGIAARRGLASGAEGPAGE